VHLVCWRNKILEEEGDICECLLDISSIGNADKFLGGRQLRGTVYYQGP
jgi:hypothetical protein